MKGSIVMITLLLLPSTSLAQSREVNELANEIMRPDPALALRVRKAKAEVAAAANDYKASLEKLLAFLENDVKAASEQVEKRKEFLALAMWKGEMVPGDRYALVLRKVGGKVIVTVHAVTSNVKTGPTTQRVSRNGPPAVESRELPLNRKGAEQLVQKYLDDLDPQTHERTVERLCASIDSTNWEDAA
jgi:hypothetical protein